MKNYYQILKNKIKKKKSLIGIIGLGYVGLPLVSKFTSEGFKVIGFDNDNKKINLLNKKKLYIDYIKISKSNFKNLNVTKSFKYINKVDIIIICLPTPLNKNKSPDLDIIKKNIDEIIPYLKKGQLLILESTSYPGTTDEIIVKKLKNKAYSIGKDYFIGYSPEREDPGNIEYSISNIPKIVSGYSKKCRLLVDKIYKSIVRKTYISKNLETAEITKLFENIFRSINIGLVNELKILTNRMNIDIFEIIKAASTKPFGFMPFYPGPGLGGHCIPIDPFYLTWKAKEYNYNTKFIELAGEINSQMPAFVIEQLQNALNLHSKFIKNSKILLIGISYKKNIDDIRESPSLEIIDILKKKEANVFYSDKYFRSFPKTSKLGLQNIKNIKIDKKKFTKI